jgi:hypothetical protein
VGRERRVDRGWRLFCSKSNVHSGLIRRSDSQKLQPWCDPEAGASKEFATKDGMRSGYLALPRTWQAFSFADIANNTEPTSPARSPSAEVQM